LAFFTFVRERPTPWSDGERSAFYKRDLALEKYGPAMLGVLAAGTRACDEVLSCAVTKSMTAVSGLVRELQAPGVLYMRETLRLDADDPLIRLRAEIELLPDPAPQSVLFWFFSRARCGMGSRLRFCGHLDKAG